MGQAGYTDEGEGPAIVCIHGLPGSHRDWRYLAPCLGGFRLVRLDMPGFGASEGCGISASFETRTRFVIEVIERLSLTSPLIIGHSMGGAIAAMCARKAPERIAGIGLIASPGLRRHRGAPPQRALLFSWLTLFPVTSWALKGSLTRAFARAGFPASLTHKARVAALRQVAKYDTAVVADAMRHVRVPTLVAYAEDDPLVETDISAELAELCPRGPRLPFSTGGHNTQKSRCWEIADAIRAWDLWS